MLLTDPIPPMGFSHPIPLFLLSCPRSLYFTKVLMEGSNMVAILGSVYIRDSLFLPQS